MDLKNILNQKIFELSNSNNEGIKYVYELTNEYIDAIRSKIKLYQNINDEGLIYLFFSDLCKNKYSDKNYQVFMNKMKRKIINKLITLSEDELIEFLKEFDDFLNYNKINKHLLIDKFYTVLNVAIKNDYFNLFRYVVYTFFIGNVYSKLLTLTIKDLFVILINNKEYIDFEKYYNLIKRFEHKIDVRVLSKLYSESVDVFFNTKAYRMLIDKFKYEDITKPKLRKNGTLTLKKGKFVVKFYVSGKALYSSTSIELGRPVKNEKDAEELIDLFFHKRVISLFYWNNKDIINTKFPEFNRIEKLNIYNICDYINKLLNKIIETDIQLITEFKFGDYGIRECMNTDAMNIINMLL